ncbi:MAG: 16S rRNA (adenine(1518)-N(6)/adenine(1519)-N(6))-dimethyltransferase RsmA [Mycoplasmataceae bacterium]|jgi:16S rRNA (adenine1518-N6/adenine1519-N6)-dimethyltransferase|nr:16S rRNA (adenine(1518)-N(6)/adenine(1519)-N(6))-dimethyltransferase RsmA [Mycoplasmataceae bacterium]
MDTKEFLTSHNFNPSKKMGQNFLINEEVCKNIVDSIDFTNVDCVIEIGPGLGAITKYIVQKSNNVIAIEIDKRLSEYISKTYPQIKLINEDVLKVDFNELTNQYKNPIIISNLPYSISSLVVIKFIKSNIQHMYCMLQKEMVERMLAVPKTHEYNGFTVLLNTYTTITKTMNISKNNFMPAPEVDSIFIAIHRNENTFDPQYDKFIKQCFGSKRRTLNNNIKNIIDKKSYEEFLNKKHISLLVRAEELDYKTFLEMYKQLVVKQ